jgi:hypothetical protein
VAIDIVIDDLLRDFASEFDSELVTVNLFDNPAPEFGMGDSVAGREVTFVRERGRRLFCGIVFLGGDAVFFVAGTDFALTFNRERGIGNSFRLSASCGLRTILIVRVASKGNCRPGLAERRGS